MVGFSVRPASKESCHPLPLRRPRRRGVHFTPVRRNPETPPAKTNYFCYGGSLSGYGFTFWGGGFGIRKQIMGLAVLYARQL
jgi:hypothetical protein